MGPKGARDAETGLTPQQELFAREVARGCTLAEASRNAGYDGHPANASKRASLPKIKDRIAKIREETVALGRAAKEAELKAAEEGFGEQVTMPWLIREAQRNMVEARSTGKYKDANDALRLIAQFAGFIRAPQEPRDADSNQEKPVGHDQPQGAVNLQIVNQFVGGLNRAARAGAEEAAADPAAAGGASGTLLEHVRSVTAADVLDVTALPVGDGVPQEAAGSGSPEPVPLRRVSDT